MNLFFFYYASYTLIRSNGGWTQNPFFSYNSKEKKFIFVCFTTTDWSLAAYPRQLRCHFTGRALHSAWFFLPTQHTVVVV